MILKLAVLLGLALVGTGSAAQVRAPEPIIHSGGKVLTLAWGGLTWHIPQRFFFGIRTWGAPKTQNSETLWIQSGWNMSHDDFRPPSMKGYDIMLDIKVSKLNDASPEGALELIHRIHLPFTKISIFASAKFNGMSYLGTSSTNHYFILNNRGSYVSCRLITVPKMRPPNVPPDALSRQFTCETVFAFPRNNYVRVSMWGIGLNEAAPSFNAAHRLLLSFLR